MNERCEDSYFKKYYLYLCFFAVFETGVFIFVNKARSMFMKNIKFIWKLKKKPLKTSAKHHDHKLGT